MFRQSSKLALVKFFDILHCSAVLQVSLSSVSNKPNNWKLGALIQHTFVKKRWKQQNFWGRVNCLIKRSGNDQILRFYSSGFCSWWSNLTETIKKRSFIVFDKFLFLFWQRQSKIQLRQIGVTLCQLVVFFEDGVSYLMKPINRNTCQQVTILISFCFTIFFTYS